MPSVHGQAKQNTDGQSAAQVTWAVLDKSGGGRYYIYWIKVSPSQQKNPVWNPVDKATDVAYMYYINNHGEMLSKELIALTRDFRM